MSHATAKEIGSKRKQEVLFKNLITKKSDIRMIFEKETLMLSYFYGTPRVLCEVALKLIEH